MLYYLASVVLTALVEVGVVLIANGDNCSRIHEILEDKSRTIGLILILAGLGLTPVVNLFVALTLIVMGWDEL